MRRILNVAGILWIGIGLFALPSVSASEKPFPINGLPERQQRAEELNSLQSLKEQLELLKADYAKRIQELEAKVQQLQLDLLKASPEPEPAGQTQSATQTVVQSIPGAFNPAIAVVGNFLARADSQKVFTEDGDRIDNKVNLRETEVDFRVPIDPYADGVLITAFESEAPGRMNVDIEEGYVNIKKLPFLDQPPLGLKLKVGKFRPAFGTINILHTHDLPQSFRPLVVEEFLGEEGFTSSGVSGNFFLPTPWDSASSLDMTLQFLNGGGIALSPDFRARNAYLGHLRWFKTFNDAHNVTLGWSTYHHPAGNEVAAATLHGMDFTYRWKPARRAETNSFVLGSELMFSNSVHAGAGEAADAAHALEGLPGDTGHPMGYTLFGQWQFNRRTYGGIRWDRTDVLFSPELHRRSLTPYFSYYFSEFLRFRLNFEHRWSDLATENRRNSVFAEINWVFGAHPPEPFWVNK
jgi:hypothetical protein